MYKYFFSLILMGACLSSNAQTKDSVSTGTSNANDVYYSFANGVVKTQANNDWDLAFDIGARYASIMANHVKGIEVWQSPYSYAKWSSFDTAGMKTWKRMYNSPATWSLGAFNRHTDNNFDLGWGTYYQEENHIVKGDSIFLIKFPNGTFQKLTIINLYSGVYNFKYADINGLNEKTKAIDKVDFKNKNFAYYSFASELNIDREPLTAEWDIVFTKYIDFVPTPYPVAGIWTNKGVTTAEARKVALSTTDYSKFRFSDTNSVIGYDWKKYDVDINKYAIKDSLVYFVNVKNVIWKLVMKDYKGGPAGKYYFTKQALTSTINNIALTGNDVYPNPVNQQLNIKTASGNSLVNYSITDISGKQILKGSEVSTDVSSLKPGIYFITLNTDKGFQTLKFIKTTF